MKRIGFFGCLLLGFCLILGAASAEGPKVFISVDMEGISAVVTSEECSRSGQDYGIFRRIMTEDANAAIEGAFAAGASEVWVRDSHGSARNILPELLDPRAILIRDWSGGHKMMMEGIDETFDAVMFVGYHAQAGTPNAIIDHTMSGQVLHSSVNGVSLPEAGWNALIAGFYDVPVVFLSGDEAICKQARSLFGQVETVAVKDAIGAAAVCLHPKKAQTYIRDGAKKAIMQLGSCKPFKLNSPYKLVLQLKTETRVFNKAFYPGAERTGDWELTFVHENLMEVVKAFVWALN